MKTNKPCYCCGLKKTKENIAVIMGLVALPFLLSTIGDTVELINQHLVLAINYISLLMVTLAFAMLGDSQQAEVMKARKWRTNGKRRIRK